MGLNNLLVKPGKPVNPAMVIVAREARGLTQAQLAAALGVTQGRLSKIEHGLLPVPEDLLMQLAEVLNYPPHFFQQEGERQGIGIAEWFHRKRQSVPAKIEDKISAQMDIRRRHIAALMQAADIPCHVPNMSVEDYRGGVEEIAGLVRATWHVPRGPIADMTKLLEDAGILIVLFDFGTPRIDAISRWATGFPPLIYANEQSPKDRLRFSLAHELGHLVMHAEPRPEIEDEADRFAAEFLMPARDIRADLSNLTLANLTLLKRYWKVSMQALLKRAEDLGEITTNQARYLWTQMGKAGYRNREPVELDVSGEQPTLLQELVDTHQKELGYSAIELRDMLALNEDELREFYLPQRRNTRLHIVRGI